MRFESIEIEWFRGAGAKATLPLGGKSIAVYGPNGAGKSSFVDAVEYLLCDGRIGHLTHEYSGKKQEKGVLNTQKPTLTPAKVRVDFTDKSHVEAAIQDGGAFTMSGDGLVHIEALDYRQVVLRQDEVARFISSAKGEKYSALLPLLGLEQLEAAAENVRQLGKRLEKRTEIDKKRGELSANRSHAGAFEKKDQVEQALKALQQKYAATTPSNQGLGEDCSSVEAAIRARVEQVSPDAARHAALRSLAASRLESALVAWDSAAQALAETATKMLAERVGMLERAKKLTSDDKSSLTECPVCGQSVEKGKVSAHVEAELLRLAGEQKVLDEYRKAEDGLVAVVTTTRQSALEAAVVSWWLALDPTAQTTIDWLKRLNPQEVRGTEGKVQRTRLQQFVLPSVKQADADSKFPPPGTTELVTDHDSVQRMVAFVKAEALEAEVWVIEKAAAHLTHVERAIRDEISSRSDAVVADISTDVQRMWATLHPGNEIENVRLSHPDGADKAIDIELKFFGVEQRSPRLTLSEGNRNSLGLCVFLSMAKRTDKSVPVILDDVVVSLDREHRGMLVNLILSEFGERQVILLTHDRDWFAELGHLLVGGWSFRSLRPYTVPAEGIAWSDKPNGLDEARAYLASAPDIAANVARKIMDTQLALLADKLRLTMEFRQGIKNDQRTAHDFLTRLIGVCEKAYQVPNQKGEYEPSPSIKQVLQAADARLKTTGNKGSHTFDVVRAEAEALIEASEAVLALFVCPKCKKPIYKMDDGSKIKQCECSAIRWRYDKA